MKILKEKATNNEFGFIAYIPENLSDAPALIVQLHGAGERGDGDTNLDKVLVHGFSKIVNDDNLKDAILIMPQCPNDTFWAARVESIKKFIDNAITRFNVDKNRVYLCGISMGGFGTWYTAMAYPNMFAAIAPCCGGGMAWNAATLKMPVLAFHGLADDVVSPRHTIEMVEALERSGANVKCSLYENVGHDSWNKAFQNELLEWLLAQSK
ncbi:MAG: prolyl oligopeptidase family serine peptidase [Clostridia bacterium]|nr:prolyl oligopeptidase family serine peptidase [Clostridia bacterium]